MDPKYVQNGQFGLKLGPNEAESTPGPFPNPPGPKSKNPKTQSVLPKMSGGCQLAWGMSFKNKKRPILDQNCWDIKNPKNWESRPPLLSPLGGLLV